MDAATQVNARGVSEVLSRYCRIDVRTLSPAIGAAVECGDVKSLDDESVAEIRRAWLDHLVLLFRGQQLSDSDLLAFARRFGESEKSPATSGNQQERPNPYISIISNVLENGVRIGSLGDGEAIWHTDMSNRQVPPSGSILYALEVPPRGGETGFLNMYHALDTLAPEMRARIERLTIRHDGGHNSSGLKRRVVLSASHPIVRTHPETKRDALYLGRRLNASVDGLPGDESDALLDALWAHATRPRFAWHHEWRVGDLLMWDNRCCIHHRNAFDPDARRVMHRTQIVGTRP